VTALEQIRPTTPPAPVNGWLTRIGFEALADFAQNCEDLAQTIDDLGRLGDVSTARHADQLTRQLDMLEASVTMIGQVKAGKTSLVNAIVGMPDLLPADVNPWTSVVTSLHMTPAGFPDSTRASFKFFGDEEWNRLVSRGGRLGELASRAGAEDELEKVRLQLEAMREKSRQRLGKRFELLLNQQHDYDHFDRALIERYVCMGDDLGEEGPTNRLQGRFADITRSADLFIERPDLPMGLCIRDTPGVNDTFMMREQITIRAIRESRLCVVVLSAHQALSSVDLALIRLISNVKSREVVIFVNRIDELADPAREVPEIRDSIRATLKAQNGPEDAELVFGSAYWANCALTGDLDDMVPASAEALVNWAESLEPDLPDGAQVELAVWELSGVPTLVRALSARIAEGVGDEALVRVARAGQNLGRTIAASMGGLGSRLELRAEREGIVARVGQIETSALEKLERRMTVSDDDFRHRLDRAHRTFLERATGALIDHLERRGEGEVWQYDASGLRLLLRSAYQVFGAATIRQVQTLFDETAEAFAGLCRDGFRGIDEDFKVEAPRVPRVPPPVQLGQTIALDLKGNWWSSWWRRQRGYRRYANEFYAMIEAETKPMVDDLRCDITSGLAEESRRVLGDFLARQRALVTTLMDRADDNVGAADHGRAGRLAELLNELSSFADTGEQP